MNASASFFLALALFATATCAQKCAVESDVISVSGVGRRDVPTSIAVVNLGISVQGETATGVQTAVAAQSTTLVDFLEASNVTKLTTTGVRLNPRFNFNNGTQNLIGYTGSNSVSFEVPVASAGEILDGAVANGATRISSVSFKPTGAASQTGRSAALKDAVAAALLEAQTIAMAAGLSLGRAVRINVQDSFTPQSQPATALARAAPVAEAASTPIRSGDATITARVAITYSTSAAATPLPIPAVPGV